MIIPVVCKCGLPLGDVAAVFRRMRRRLYEEELRKHGHDGERGEHIKLRQDGRGRLQAGGLHGDTFAENDRLAVRFGSWIGSGGVLC